jgi:hypothetical protein
MAWVLDPYTAQARWNNKEDNMSEPTLEAMTDQNLFNEAFDVCVRRAMVERQGSDQPGFVTGVSEDAANYLGVIKQVASNRNEGVAPSWMLQLAAAHTVKECQRAFRTFLIAQQPRKAPVAKKAAPHVAKKVATPRHGNWVEQLPPWFAPQQR